jgi:gelsolin
VRRFSASLHRIETVELDHLLGDVAVQHREVMGNETELFLSYFPKGLKLMKGGADSGFTHAETNAGVEAKPSLWWVKGTKGNFVLKEVKISRKNMNSGDVFILDIGNEVWQWNGKSSNAFEKLKAEEFIRSLQADRGGPGRCDMHMLEEGEDDEEKAPQFCRYLPTHKGVMLGMVQVDVNVAPADKGGNDEDVKPFVPTLSELRGINFVEVAKAPPHTRIAQYMLRETHVYVLDTGFQLYVWIGKLRSQAM